MAAYDRKALRQALRNLPDGEDERRGFDADTPTLAELADRLGADPSTLRSLRDSGGSGGGGGGGGGRASDKIGDELVSAYVRLLGQGASATGRHVDPVTGQNHLGLLPTRWREARDRDGRDHLYDVMETTRTEVSSALDAWADLGVGGSLGIGGQGPGGGQAGAFAPVVHNANARKRRLMSDLCRDVDSRLLPAAAKWQVFRGMAHYGRQWEEIVLDQEGPGKTWRVARLEPRHVRTMWVNRGQDGKIDPAAYYAQRTSGRQDRNDVEFPLWKILHFAIRPKRTDDDGRSVLASCLRAYTQVEAMESAMITRRLEHASRQLKHTVFVGHVGHDQKQVKKTVDDYRNANSRDRTVDYKGRLAEQIISMPGGEDVIVPRRDKEDPGNVEVLPGDPDVGKIEDFLHFFNKLLAGLGPPKAHLGYEADTMRSVVTDLHIVFARKVRRAQLAFAEGLERLYWLKLVLRGIDPRSVQFTLTPPTPGTRDELVRAQVLLAHATTVRYLADAFAGSGEVPSVEWFLRYVLRLDEEAIESLDLVPVLQSTPANAAQPGGGRDEPSKKDEPKGAGRDSIVLGTLPASDSHRHQTLSDMADAARPLVADGPEGSAGEHLRGAMFLLGERALSRGRLDVAGRAGLAGDPLYDPILSQQARRHACPFDGRFEDVLRLLKVTRLSAA